VPPTKRGIVFATLLLGFELQRRDPRHVGVNLVQPEDDPVALSDYTLQMHMIQYLRSAYPSAHVTLHAGEIVPGLVPALDLQSHIRQAVEIAGAERIGHGVDVVSETNAGQLLAVMARARTSISLLRTAPALLSRPWEASAKRVTFSTASTPPSRNPSNLDDVSQPGRDLSWRRVARRVSGSKEISARPGPPA